MSKITDIFFSFKLALSLLAILAIGAGVATFIENDYGTSTARVLVFNHLWYEMVFVLISINLSCIMYKRKMWKVPARFLIHSSFLVILLGAGITRYMGYEGIIHIREGETSNLMISQEPYLQVRIKLKNKGFYKEFPMEFGAIGDKHFSHDISFDEKILNVTLNNFFYVKKGKDDMSILTVDATLNGITKTVKLPGKRGIQGVPRTVSFGDTLITMEYGSKTLKLPFSLRLNDFQLERYPGSMSPASYASEVTVIKKGEKPYDYRIFMNNTLKEGNFLFFQSSFDPDEKGTVLSVNNDPGKWPTYFGYMMLILGFTLNLFDKKSRFSKLTKMVKEKNIAYALILSLLSFSALDVKAETLPFVQQEVFIKYAKDLNTNAKDISQNFAKLTVQSNGGRMKPLEALNKEIVNKLSGRDNLFSLNYNQIVLGMLSRPEIWRDVKMISIKTPKLKKILGLDVKSKYIAFSDVFKDGKYLLQEESQTASMTSPNERGTYERDIIAVDERLNVAYMVFNGDMFKIFPQEKSSKENNKWYAPLEAFTSFKGMNQTAVQTLVNGFITNTANANYTEADKYLALISQYQYKVGFDVVLSKAAVEREIFLDKLDIFFKLTIAYMVFGVIILITAFIVIFNPKINAKKITLFFTIITIALFSIHTFGMGLRWVVSGHAPWTNTYESMLYISWSSMFAAVAFFRRSLLALSSAIIMAGIFMFTAHLTGVNPQITNLVPVLNSYWLTIHVSILTASYGFFGLGAFVSFSSLILFIFRNEKRKHFDGIIKHLAAITEIALIIGLTLISIGNFLGAIWANESWGRYWGWDPKETWAYVSIIVYAIVIHLRFIKSFNNPFVFSSAALLAFSSIIMTYVGVNFYLSGLHSYATGDPIPIPTWTYYTFATILLTIILASRKRNLNN
ncbi:MAG: cytochrome c biogenesis protein CcsA [Campylobacteraceae bacterium]|nr:cytochrome c biogenesis protein CcsA [Campylobacteraceae bacterium]